MIDVRLIIYQGDESMLMKWVPFFAFLFLIMNNYGSLHAEKRQTKIIVFDFGSVIAKTDKQQVIHFISQSLKISPEDAQHVFQQLKEHTSQEKGEKEFWNTYAKEKKVTLPDHWLEKLDEERLSALQEIPGMVHLVKDLQRQGYQTALLSNVRGSQAAIKRKLGYYNLFDPVLLSYEIGIKKPDPEIYKLLLSKLQALPQTVLFIDNKQANVDAAKELGVDGIVFLSSDQLIQELGKRGIEISTPESTVRK